MVKYGSGQTDLLDVYMKNKAFLTLMIRHGIMDVANLALSTPEC
jgi:hypothetical protein